MNIIKYQDKMKLEKGKLYQTDEGVYRLIDNKLCKAVTKIKNFDNKGEIKEELTEIRLPKLPYDLYKQIYSFFKSVYTEHKSEVAVLLWYNFERKDWFIEVPKQKVSGASVNYDRDLEENKKLESKGYICVGSIHSHCEMGAFHSGTDDGDEYNFDGFHMTIGKVMSGPEHACRFIVKDVEYKMKFEECVEVPLEDEAFPKEWSEKVSKYSYAGKNASLYGFYGANWTKKSDNHWFKNYDDEEEKEDEKEDYDDMDYCPVCYNKYKENKQGVCKICGYDPTQFETFYDDEEGR